MFELEFNRGNVVEGTDAEIDLLNEAREDELAASPIPGARNILLKGQMKYIEDVNAIVFLCSPV